MLSQDVHRAVLLELDRCGNTRDGLKALLGVTGNAVGGALRALRGAGLVEREDDWFYTTHAGEKAAEMVKDALVG